MMEDTRLEAGVLLILTFARVSAGVMAMNWNADRVLLARAAEPTSTTTCNAPEFVMSANRNRSYV